MECERPNRCIICDSNALTNESTLSCWKIAMTVFIVIGNASRMIGYNSIVMLHLSGECFVISLSPNECVEKGTGSKQTTVESECPYGSCFHN